MESIVLKQRSIWLKIYVRTRFVLRRLGSITHKFAIFKLRGAHIALTIAPYLKLGGKEVHSLDTYAIHAHRLLESLRVILTTCVKLADGRYHLTLRNTSTIVAKRYSLIFIQIYLNTLTCIHAELVDRVVYRLLQQHVYSIFSVRAISQSAYIHTRSAAHVLYVAQLSDVIIIVINGLSPRPLLERGSYYVFLFIYRFTHYLLLFYSFLINLFRRLLFFLYSPLALRRGVGGEVFLIAPQPLYCLCL